MTPIDQSAFLLQICFHWQITAHRSALRWHHHAQSAAVARSWDARRSAAPPASIRGARQAFNTTELADACFSTPDAFTPQQPSAFACSACCSCGSQGGLGPAAVSAASTSRAAARRSHRQRLPPSTIKRHRASPCTRCVRAAKGCRTGAVHPTRKSSAPCGLG